MPAVARLTLMTLIAGLSLCATARAGDPIATLNKVTPQGIGEAVGTVRVVKSGSGAVFNLNLKDLPPGSHGMHVHENGDCGPGMTGGNAVAAGAAGGHWDPGHTSKHAGPLGEGHAGDLPALEVLEDGTATKSIIAPRITDVEAVRGHALMIHAGGDNYADSPAPLGGGGARIACGVIK